MTSFSTGLTALNAARLAMETVGQNLANASTPGYTRERVNLASLAGTAINGRRVGGGVAVRNIERVTDELLVSRLRAQNHEVGRREAQVQMLSEVENVFNEPSDAGLNYQLSAFFNQTSSLVTSPTDSQVRAALVGSGATLAEQIRTIRSGLTDTARGVRGIITSSVQDVNRLADTLATINKQITSSRSADGPPASLLDRRTQVLDELSTYVDVDVQELRGGSISVTVGGQTLVSDDKAKKLSITDDANGFATLVLEDAAANVDPSSGRLKGLLEFERTGTGDRIAKLDLLAKTLITNFNRIHATGIPEAGGYDHLQASNAIVDSDGDGDYSDELLESAGLPFEMTSGELWVTTIDTATNAVSRTKVSYDPKADKTGDLMRALDAVDGIRASIDGSGRLVITADSGKMFHFANILDPNPDGAGAFGAATAQMTGSQTGPFALTAGDTFTVSIDGGPAQTVTFNATQFADITHATADEVAAAIASQLTGGTAVAADGRILIRSSTVGASSQITLADGTGSPLSDFGIAAGSDTGDVVGVSATVSGTFTGSTEQTFTFTPRSSGTIGVDAGLKIDVKDASGRVLKTIDVGAGYVPGTAIEVLDGISVKFSPGSISASAGDYFNVTGTPSSDSGDALVAFGIGSFFAGHDAASIEVDDHLMASPAMLAIGLNQTIDDALNLNTDNQNAARLLGLRDGALTDLGDQTMGEFYGNLISDVGRETASSQLALDTQTSLLDSVRSRLEQVRGVSVDEELADLQRYQQAYQAAARYITAVNDLTQTLLNI